MVEQIFKTKRPPYLGRSTDLFCVCVCVSVCLSLLQTLQLTDCRHSLNEYCVTGHCNGFPFSFLQSVKRIWLMRKLLKQERQQVTLTLTNLM